MSIRLINTHARSYSIVTHSRYTLKEYDMRHSALIIVLFSCCSQAIAAVQADAGPDIVLQSPFPHASLQGSASGGTPHWYQVSGPAVARFRTPAQAQTQVALPEPGQYVFRLRVTAGSTTAQDEVAVTLNPAAPLSETSLALDHLAVATLANPMNGHRSPPLLHHNLGVNAHLAMMLAERFGYGHMFIVTPDTRVVKAIPADVDASKENPLKYPLVPQIRHAENSSTAVAQRANPMI